MDRELGTDNWDQTTGNQGLGDRVIVTRDWVLRTRDRGPGSDDYELRTGKRGQGMKTGNRGLG